MCAVLGREMCLHLRATVDGKNPAPVDRYFIPLFTRFDRSQVVQDFFHQQDFVWGKKDVVIVVCRE